MTIPRKTAWIALGAVCLAALLAPWLRRTAMTSSFEGSAGNRRGRSVPHGYGMDIGRDRLSRLLYATRVSLGLAPAAAAVLGSRSASLSSLIALRRNRFAREALSGITTISLSLPWIFLFVIMRAETAPEYRSDDQHDSYLRIDGNRGLGLAGKVFTASLRALVDAEWMVQARASGLRPWRIAIVHLWPHVRSIAWAQFRVLVPAYHFWRKPAWGCWDWAWPNRCLPGAIFCAICSIRKPFGQPLDTGAAWPADAGDDLSGGAGWIEA